MIKIKQNKTKPQVRFVFAFLCTSLVFSQIFQYTAAIADEPSNTLTITHTAKVPNGREYVLGVEEINNITDIYYYNPAQSPMASKFLKNGYAIANEKNAKIEADVVSNGGEINLEYTPTLGKINVTYYKTENGVQEKMGEITDSAYVGEEYEPLLPLYGDAENFNIKAVENKKHVVAMSDNNFSVMYEVIENAPDKERLGNANEGEGAPLSGYSLSKDTAYINGYPDETFRPDKKITKGELFQILYSLSGKSPAINRLQASIDGLKSIDVITEAEEKAINERVTWQELRGYLTKLNESFVNADKLKGLESDYWYSYFDTSQNVTRAEAVAAINDLLGRDVDVNKIMSSDNCFTDVYEDYWAYWDIVSAAAGR